MSDAEVSGNYGVSNLQEDRLQVVQAIMRRKL